MRIVLEREERAEPAPRQHASLDVVADLETVPCPDVPPPPAEEGSPRRLPAPPYHRIAVAGWLVLRDEVPEGFEVALGERASAEALSRVLADDRARLVTWNGRRFDGPVLRFACMRSGIPFPAYARDLRGRGGRHLDLCAELADHGAAPLASLDATARALGLPGKGDVSGEDVEGLCASGRADRVASYCLSDVAQLAAILLRHRLVAGEIGREAYLKAVEALRAAVLAEPRLAQLHGASWDVMLGPSTVTAPPAPPAPGCPRCGASMARRRGARGPFWGCERYPECRGTVDDAAKTGGDDA